ncbi:hypothetical protein ACGFYU_16610 [Streptomyces sp. NPDC048337]|uniref:hypothetical protein n=1 Tax=Streptomyces sp. NPDC048337 TaxID=3365535 RepID=UPI00372027F3
MPSSRTTPRAVPWVAGWLLAAAVAGRPVLAGAVLAGACALKWTALPAVAVVVALLAACRGTCWPNSAPGAGT